MNYLTQLKQTIDGILCDKEQVSISYNFWLEDVCNFLLGINEKSTLYFIGNGGSAGIAMHMTTDFFKNGGMKTHSMHDPTILTCLGNDFGYEYVFDKQLEGMAVEGDVLIAISSSGNSPNIVKAIHTAHKHGCTVITFSGFKQDNAIRTLGTYNLYVPSLEYGIVESIHNIVLQQLVDILKERKQQ